MECESCGVNPALDEPVKMIGVNARAWICQACLRVGRWPYSLVVAQQAMLGIGEGNGAWQGLVRDTVAGHGVSWAQFQEDVGRLWLLWNARPDA